MTIHRITVKSVDGIKGNDTSTTRRRKTNTYRTLHISPFPFFRRPVVFFKGRKLEGIEMGVTIREFGFFIAPGKMLVSQRWMGYGAHKVLWPRRGGIDYRYSKYGSHWTIHGYFTLVFPFSLLRGIFALSFPSLRIRFDLPLPSNSGGL